MAPLVSNCVSDKPLLCRRSIATVAFFLGLVAAASATPGNGGQDDKAVKYEVQFDSTPIVGGGRIAGKPRMTAGPGSDEDNSVQPNDEVGSLSGTSNWIKMRLPNGSSYDCFLPNEKAILEDQKMAASRKVPIGEEVPEALASKVAAIMDGKCFVKLAGWWIYELCWEKGLRQFHIGAQKELETEYYLGRGPLATDSTTTVPVPGGATTGRSILHFGENTLSGVYVTSSYPSGSTCDLTGKGRVSEIRAVCGQPLDDQDGGASLEVTEPETCRYVATIVHKDLCKLRELRKEEDVAYPIRCHISDPSMVLSPPPEN